MVFYSVASVQNAAQRKSEATRIVASQRSGRRDAKKGWCHRQSSDCYKDQCSGLFLGFNLDDKVYVVSDRT